jgi:sulfur carrier protein ThiS adenylyltransferase
MTGSDISILVNEHPLSLPSGTTIQALAARMKPGADVLVVNGFPVDNSYILVEGDNVALIKRGEQPSREELESLMASRHSPGVHARLKKSAVGVAGLGGLGSAVATALSRTGVGTLVLADHDVVEPSNLNRQQYFVEHLGMPKSRAMEGLLSRINPFTRIVSYQVRLDASNTPDIFGDTQVIVECFDRAEEKVMFMETVADRLPEAYLIAASGLAGYGESNRIRTFRVGERIFLVGDMVSAAERGRGLMAPRVGIAAHHQANLAVSLLMDPEKALQETEELLSRPQPWG